MNGKSQINIAGKEYKLYFGEPAIKILWKALFDDQYANPDMEQLLKEMNELVNENYFSFKKLMLFAGMAGYELAFTDKFRPSITIEHCGELVTQMTEKEEAEFLASPWLAFWDSFGASLEKIRELEGVEESKAEKKK